MVSWLLSTLSQLPYFSILNDQDNLVSFSLYKEIAEKAGMVNLLSRHLFHSAIRTGRRVREETGISKNAVSVSSVAVDLAETVVDNLQIVEEVMRKHSELPLVIIDIAIPRDVEPAVRQIRDVFLYLEYRRPDQDCRVKPKATGGRDSQG